MRFWFRSRSNSAMAASTVAIIQPCGVAKLDLHQLYPPATNSRSPSSAAPRFNGRKRVHDAAEAMARITAERVVEHLERSGYVVMCKPPLGERGTPGNLAGWVEKATKMDRGESLGVLSCGALPHCSGSRMSWPEQPSSTLCARSNPEPRSTRLAIRPVDLLDGAPCDLDHSHAIAFEFRVNPPNVGRQVASRSQTTSSSIGAVASNRLVRGVIGCSRTSTVASFVTGCAQWAWTLSVGPGRDAGRDKFRLDRIAFKN